MSGVCRGALAQVARMGTSSSKTEEELRQEKAKLEGLTEELDAQLKPFTDRRQKEIEELHAKEEKKLRAKEILAELQNKIDDLNRQRGEILDKLKVEKNPELERQSEELKQEMIKIHREMKTYE